MTKNETIIKARAMEALHNTLQSSAYDTDDDQLNSYIAGATIAINKMLHELSDLDWLEKSEN